MTGLMIILPAALLLGGVFVWLFLVAVNQGQFDDLDDAPTRMLMDEDTDGHR